MIGDEFVKSSRNRKLDDEDLEDWSIYWRKLVMKLNNTQAKHFFINENRILE